MGFMHKWKWECTAATPSALGYFLDLVRVRESSGDWVRILDGPAGCRRVPPGAASGRRLVSKVGETFELVLVDLLDDVGVRRRQHGLLPSKVLVKVVHVPFGFLGREK